MPMPVPTRSRRRWAVTVAALVGSVVVAAGCLGAGAATDPPGPVDDSSGVGPPRAVVVTPSVPSLPRVPPAPPDDEPGWVVGAELLPLRPDGFAEIGPTPEPLIDRQLPTPPGVLDPPVDDSFASSIAEIDEAVRARMGRTWEPGCPVGLDDLRYATVTFWGFDGGHHTGELVLHRDVVDDVVWVFEQLHATRFPLEEVRLITDADLDAAATGDGNVTAAYVCRPVRGGASWSEHAFGRAVDINPFHNPYQRRDVVLPERASAYLDRDHARPGMVHDGDVVTASFAAIGWHWGGTWSSPDHMHFSTTGR